MIKPKFTPIVLFLTVILFSPVLVQAQVDLTSDGKVPGKPFQDLQNQINNLQNQINNIPAGPPGPAGADGVGCSISGSIITCPNGMSDVSGADGADGEQGPAGTSGALADKVVAFGRVLGNGQSPWGTGNYTVEHEPGTNIYVITINELMACNAIEPTPGNFAGIARGMIVGTPMLPPGNTLIAFTPFVPLTSLDDCPPFNPQFVVLMQGTPPDGVPGPTGTEGNFHFQIIGDSPPTP